MRGAANGSEKAAEAAVDAANLIVSDRAHLPTYLILSIGFSGFFTIPTYLNLFHRNNLNCPRWTILLGSSFEIGLDKVRHIITLSIAGERIYALFRPGDYFFLDHRMVSLQFTSLLCVSTCIPPLWRRRECDRENFQ
uniref:Uncharacterized protein n=1 Tax=Caenorhabditis japonica TaxID=281687 RepID=A0A8R1IRR5_CAEJA